MLLDNADQLARPIRFQLLDNQIQDSGLFLSSPQHRCDRSQAIRARGQTKRLPGSGLERKSGSAASEALVVDEQNKDKEFCSETVRISEHEIVKCR